jgi:hypothetical protein
LMSAPPHGTTALGHGSIHSGPLGHRCPACSRTLPCEFRSRTSNTRDEARKRCLRSLQRNWPESHPRPIKIASCLGEL